MISKSLKQELSQYLKMDILNITAVSGGDINPAFKLSCIDQNYFLKLNSANRFPDMLKLEAKSLSLLSEKTSFDIPRVIHSAVFENQQFLLLEWLEASESKASFEAFATKLANLHRNTNNSFGLNFNNYIGSLHQSNKTNTNWFDFFIAERLEAQLQVGNVPKRYFSMFKQLFPKLDELLFSEAPALLHGDLWSGNILQNGNEFTLIDPAIYYGNREADIAMTALFGGFPQEFYAAYAAAFPLEMGWQERLEIYQLYPLLVHVNLFGESYLQGVEKTIKKFT